MEKYVLIKQIGSGTFGSVWKATHKQSGEVVAVKALKKRYYSWEECKNLREVKSLQKLNHPNIVKLKELIKENDILYFVFEFMDCNLYELMKDREKLFSETEVRNWCFQLFQGLNYMHQKGYFHRDLKPENLLVLKDAIKIADFGLVREIGSPPPYTEYISTRWYRAPEVLLQSHLYSSKVDMWAMGAIMAELITLRPLFPGTNEANEIYKICSVIGSPTKDSWADGLHLARSINYQFPQLSGVDLSVLLPSVSEDAVSLITSLCSWDPCKRPAAAEALQHPFFQSCFYIPPPLRSRAVVSRMYSGASSNSKLMCNLPSYDLNAHMSTGVKCKLQVANQIQDPDKNEKCMTSCVKQPKYYPAAMRKNPPSVNNCRTTLGVPDMAEKLANMTIASHRQSVGQLKPSALRTGVQWNSESRDSFLRPTQTLEYGRTYTRKVIG